MPVESQQGVDYAVKTIKMPLYIKIMEFLDRDYHYKELVQRICQGCHNDKDKIWAIFEWTHNNIRKAPRDLPVVDDHVWSIIIRGYGVEDQSQDVFATLCNYAGTDAFYSWVPNRNHTKRVALSFARINGRWLVFDASRGIYFKNNNGDIADIEEIRSGNWHIASIASGGPDIDYEEYFENLGTIKNIGLKRSNIQSPLRRFIFELGKRFRRG